MHSFESSTATTPPSRKPATAVRQVFPQVRLWVLSPRGKKVAGTTIVPPLHSSSGTTAAQPCVIHLRGLMLHITCMHHEDGRFKLQLTVRNPRRARHTGGYWDLGDPG